MDLLCGLRLWLVPRGLLRLVSLHLRKVGVVSRPRLHLDFQRAVGVAAIPLWALGLHAQRLRVGLDSRRLSDVVARHGELVSRRGLDRLDAAVGERRISASGLRTAGRLYYDDG